MKPAGFPLTSAEHDPQLRPRETLRDPATGTYHKSLNAAIIADVPLDPRSSLYLWWGDWFAAACLVMTLGSLGWSALMRNRAPAG